MFNEVSIWDIEIMFMSTVSCMYEFETFYVHQHCEMY
jgi:hypothetical protein